MRIFLFLISLYLIVSCKEDKSVVNLREIKGEWDIKQATRDGQVFEAISGGYFGFGQDDVFNTNIPILPNGSTFTVNEDVISFSNDTIKYHIKEVTDSILIVESLIRETPFQFICRKKR